MRSIDLVLVLDARFEGGASTAVVTEIAALLEDPDLTVGLLLIKAHLLGLPFPVHPQIRRFITEGRVVVLRPHEAWQCRLAVIHHPVVFENMPRTALPLRAEQAVLVLHHPMRDASGALQYDLPVIVQTIRASLCDDIRIAPVSAVVRKSLWPEWRFDAPVTDIDWKNLLDPREWPFDPEPKGPPLEPIIIGRHARPDPLKWPDTREEAALAYLADNPRFEVRILGGGPFLEELYGTPLPANWVVTPFGYDTVPGFLAGLDAYVYFHSSRWSEAFGRNIMEALACGLVTVLAPVFSREFGDAALYCTPSDVGPMLLELAADPEAWAAQRHRARLWVERHCDPAFARDRLRPFGLPAPSGSMASNTGATGFAAPAVQRETSKTVLFVSTNGIGVGHLTQQMAIADRLPQGLVPAFASMCLSLHVAAEQGHPVFYLPHHKHLEAESEPWNRVLAEEIFDLLRHLRPVLLAYDGTAVFGGVTAALREFPDLMSIWVRRAMWRECHRPFLDHESTFTAVIEPGELAGDLDHGPTRARRPFAYLVPPVLHIDPAARMDRAAARRHYGLEDDHLAIALQLGSGANFEMRSLRRKIIQRLLADPRVVILDIVSPLAPLPEQADTPRLRILREFPSFLTSRAMDAAVSVAGYNAFHEQLLGGIPTLFIPNEAPEMDSQLTRAQWANACGLGLILRARHDIGALDQTVARLLDDDFRAACKDRLAGLPQENGARDIAEFVTDYSAMIRTDRWPEDIYPR
ncbi:glycosyltransferase [Natronohydrobacter thiooxidans]|uniref:glycosyltransferase n=1 Tax=Natronohydrobacter thiooxidans TaxID=87172 RepID=UPI0008FF5BBD|nr:glycosyltransferase [Natronohydrobacter thiooxidans]